MQLPLIEVNELSKIYDLGSSRELVAGWLRRFAGERRAARAKIKKLLALNRVSLSVRRGEAVGVIGANGAGKSTLLKVLTRVTTPSSGHGVVRGRVGSILEVGTGFHPELTGRENVFLSGAILGMRNDEVRKKFDDIVSFAGVEKFIDIPVKRFSTGMYVRLAFGVVAHLDPDILIVDEVLAVGDLRFQQSCLQKMDNDARTEGRTILFVSHNLQAVRTLCSRAILMDHGEVVQDGPTSDVIQRYLSLQKTSMDLRDHGLENRTDRAGGRVRFSRIWITGPSGNEKRSFRSGEVIHLGFEYEVFEAVSELGLLIEFVRPTDGVTVSSLKEVLKSTELRPGDRGKCTVALETAGWRPGSLAIKMYVGNHDCSIHEDVVDSNVKLPFLEIDSDEVDMHLRSGYFDLMYRVSAT